MAVIRGILYIFALITIAGGVDGITGEQFKLHAWLESMHVHPHNPWVAFVMGTILFIAAEYAAVLMGEPPLILIFVAFIARVILYTALTVGIASIIGIIITILASAGPLDTLRTSHPIIFFNIPWKWVPIIPWFILFSLCGWVYLRLHPNIRYRTISDEESRWPKVDEVQEEEEGMNLPLDPEGSGPVMRRLLNRGLRPIYIDRHPQEPLGRLAGDVGMLNIYVDCPRATWPDGEVMKSLTGIREAVDWIEGEATGKVRVNFKDIGHLRTPTPGWPYTDRMKLSMGEVRHQVLDMLGGIGLEGLEDLHHYLLRYSDEPGNLVLFHFYLRAGSWCLPPMHPNIGTAFCFHRHDPEVNKPHFIDSEDLKLYPQLNCVVAHHILHLFGATDKPVRTVHHNVDIMSAVALNIEDTFIGFKTAKEIGW